MNLFKIFEWLVIKPIITPIEPGTAFAIGAGLGAAGGLIGAKGSRDAARIQADAQRAATAETRRQFDITQRQLAPWRIAAVGEPIKDPETGEITGYTGGALQEYAGYGPSRVLESDYIPASEIPEFDPTIDLEADPGFRFRQAEQERALARGAAGMGRLLSGNRLEEIMARSGELASNEYQRAYGRKLDEYGLDRQREASIYSRGLSAYSRAAGREQDVLNRLWKISEAGRGVTTATGEFGAQQAANIASMQQAASSARAAGVLGQASAWQQALGDMAALGTRYYMDQKRPDTYSYYGGGVPSIKYDPINYDVGGGGPSIQFAADSNYKGWW